MIFLEKNASREECVPENYSSYFSTKTYIVDTQKNLRDETFFNFGHQVNLDSDL